MLTMVTLVLHIPFVVWFRRKGILVLPEVRRFSILTDQVKESNVIEREAYTS